MHIFLLFFDVTTYNKKKPTLFFQKYVKKNFYPQNSKKKIRFENFSQKL